MLCRHREFHIFFEAFHQRQFKRQLRLPAATQIERRLIEQFDRAGQPIEFKLLVELARQPGKVLTHRHLLREVWGPEAVEQSQYLRVHVAALRRKIEKDPARPQWLVTEAGIGYRLRDAV